MKALEWTRLGTRYTLYLNGQEAQIHKLKYFNMPAVYHCQITERGVEVAYFTKSTLRAAKAACEEKMKEKS